MIFNDNNMKATLTNTTNGVSVSVHATTDHPASSYGKPVWVDDNGQAYCQVGFEAPFYSLSDVEDTETIADRIKAAREAQGITLRQLSEQTCVNISNLSRIERGEVSPTLETLQTICKALGLTLRIE